MADLLSFVFMQRALIAGTFTGLLAGLVGFFVIVRQMSFAGVGISHAAMGAIALSLLLGTNPNFTVLIFCLFIAWAIGYLSQEGKIKEDATIGILFTSAMAFGVLIVSVYHTTYNDLFSLLFGNILAISSFDLNFLIVLATIVIIFLVLNFQKLLFFSFNEEAAEAAGIPIVPLYYGFLTILTLSVISMVQITGIILASAMLVLPVAAAYEIFSNYRQIVIAAIIIGIFSNIAGLILAYLLNWPAGATIVLLAALIFALSFVFASRRKKYHPQE